MRFGLVMLACVIAAACSDDPAVLEGSVCSTTSAGGCPPLLRCEVHDESCDDCGGVCVSTMKCESAGDCGLEGYACRDGWCHPETTCVSHDECTSGYCFQGSGPGDVSPGVCLGPSAECALPEGSTCGLDDTCVVCAWGAGICAMRELYAVHCID